MIIIRTDVKPIVQEGDTGDLSRHAKFKRMWNFTRAAIALIGELDHSVPLLEDRCSVPEPDTAPPRTPSPTRTPPPVRTPGHQAPIMGRDNAGRRGNARGYNSPGDPNEGVVSALTQGRHRLIYFQPMC